MGFHINFFFNPIQKILHLNLSGLLQCRILMKPRGMGSKFFVPGRTAMTCCADDTTFLGYVCRSDYTPHIKEGNWVEVTAKVAYENRMEYQGEGIVLYAEKTEICEPLKEEMVYFN